MGILKVLGSSSKGNCYVLQSSTECLLIELGVSWSFVKKSINYKLDNIVGAVCSHRHGDHSAYIQQVLDSGIPVYSNADVKEKYPGVTLIEKGKSIKVGEFTIQPFDLNHDVECYGYLIKHDEIGKIVFITDTCSVKYKFKGINHFLVETNYSEDIMIEKFMNSSVDIHSKMRLKESHLSLDNAIDFVNNSKDDECRTIVLLHLSDGNSNEEVFRYRMIDEVGVPNVLVADMGKIIELSNESFF